MKLTELEKEVMNIIWTLPQPVTVRDVVNDGYAEGEKAYTTIQTVMNHLTEKGILKRKKLGHVNTYAAVLNKKKFRKTELEKVVDSLFDGSALNMISFLIGSQKMSRDEIENLEKLIKENKGE